MTVGYQKPNSSMFKNRFKNINMLKILKNSVIFFTLFIFLLAFVWSYGQPETKALKKEAVKNEDIDHDDEDGQPSQQQQLHQHSQRQQLQKHSQQQHQQQDQHSQEKEDISSTIESLKARIKSLEKQSKVYPDVKFLSYQDRKRILVSGGAGFVGSHLVDKLMLQGHEVTVVDNFFTGRKRNVEQWIGHQNFELLNHDVTNHVHIEVDQIYHLASPASPPHYMYNPIKTIKTNTIGTINMLGLAKRVKARLLFASTSEVYGDPEIHPQDETYWGHVNPIGPRACYDEAKRVGETLCYAYQKQEGVEVRVARIFNTFGPRMHMNDGRVVSNFVLQALQNQAMTIYGSGKQTRSFQYVSDLVDGLVALMKSNYSRPVNIGNPEEHTIYEFATIIKKLLAGQGNIVHKAPVEDDPQRRKPDIRVAKDQLAWQPKVALLTGINRTIEYFRNELNRKQHNQRNLWKPDLYKN